MDISNFIERRDDLKMFINANFDCVEYKNLLFSPLLHSRVNFIAKTDSLKFCAMDVQQCWVNKAGFLYAFFILIKTSSEIEKHISMRYGKWETSAEISIQGERIGGDLFSWRSGEVEIDISSYVNVLRDPKYEMCDLVICRNMTFAQILGLPDAER